jgi:hypothetical protein
MPPDTPNPASAAARTRSGNDHHKRLASDFPGFKLPATHAQAQSRLRRQRRVERVHRLGPAPLLHLLNDLEAGKPVWPTVERYAALPADFIKANAGDQFAPFLWPIDGGRR